MTRNAPGWLVPAYVALCIIFGGASAGGYIANAGLQLLAVLLLALAWLARPDAASLGPKRWLWLILAAALALVLIQFIPLPVSVWRILPGRSDLAAQMDFAGIRQLYGFVSLIPHASFKSAIWLVPPAALLCVTLRAPSLLGPRRLALVITISMCLAVIVAALQKSQGSGSPLYFYDITNRGSAVGFFANANHMASLLLVTIPFQAALLAEALERTDERRLTGIAAILGTLGLTVTGIAVNGSLAGYGLLVPVSIASGLIVSPEPRLRKKVVAFLVPAVVAGGAILFATAEGRAMLDDAAAMPAGSRQQIFAVSWNAIRDMWPMGSGMGTFAELYASYEDPAAVTRTYINHAHNDYIELVLETGLAGLALLAAFLLWWARTAFRIWRDDRASPYVLAAVVASATLLAHSLVDYPLRTAALSSIFAVSIGLMALAGSASGRITQPLRTAND